MSAERRPLIFISPFVGYMIFDNNFRIVLLPAPFGPTIPTTSPLVIRKSTFLSAQNSCSSKGRSDPLLETLRKKAGIASRSELSFSPFLNFFQTLLNSITDMSRILLVKRIRQKLILVYEKSLYQNKKLLTKQNRHNLTTKNLELVSAQRHD